MTNSLDKNSSDLSEVTPPDFVIIGIGTSAGGLEALKSFFDSVPSDFQHTFVVIQHLSPDYKSLMGELLSKNTHMPIYEVRHNMPVEPASVYLIPPKKNMTLSNNRFVLTDKPDGHVLNFPINIFFESLAVEHKERSIGIVLSGTGSDGTIGLRAIKEVGGLAIVQTPTSAAFDGMPNSAINTGLIDFILPPWKMAGELQRYLETPHDKIIDQIAASDEQTTFTRIIQFVQGQVNVDFSHYKQPTLLRRLQRRIVVNSCQTLDEYLKFLQANPQEAFTLYREFLIHVTHFFRDQAAWDILVQSALPQIIAHKAPNQQIKCWVVGCSSGEEAYTLAILLDEALRKSGRKLEVKIFATDIEKEHLDQAAQAIYPESIMSDVSSERLQNYFRQVGNQYQVMTSVRRMIIFSQHDALSDPPFGKMDLVLCRNLLIYLMPEMQAYLINNLHYALNVGGFLFLGPSETIGNSSGSFTEVNRRWRIYENTKRSLGLSTNIVAIASPAQYRNPHHLMDRSSYEMADILNTTLLTEMGAASIYVDESYHVLHAVGNYEYFMKLPQGQFSLSLLKMVPESLYIALNAALQKAARLDERVSTPNIWLSLPDGKRQQIHLIVETYISVLTGSTNFLVVLVPKSISDIFAEVETDDDSDQLQYENQEVMERALKEARFQLQSALEEAQTSNEELQATNEELMASNEELQSTNEELQSVNEELHTVNTEYQLKVNELERLNTEIENLIRSTQIGTIFLDIELNIRSFTPAIHAQFALIPSDIGRPLNQLAGKLTPEDMDHLLEVADHVLKTGQPHIKEIRIKDGRYYLMRIHPYIDPHNNVGGVVLSFVDITIQKEAELEIKSLTSKLELAMDAGQIGIWENDLINRTVNWNDAMYEIYGVSQQDFDQRVETVMDFIYADDLDMVWGSWQNAIETKDYYSFTYRIMRPDHEVRHVEGKGYIQRDENNIGLYAIGYLLDVTDRVLREQELSEINTKLELAIEAGQIGIWEYDLVNGTVVWNDHMYAINGITPEDFDQKLTSITDQIHPDDLDEVMQVWEESMATRDLHEFRYRIVQPGGEVRYIEGKGYIRRNEIQKPISAVGYVLDITKSFMRERELNEVNTKLNLAIEAGQIGIWENDLVNGTFTWNDAMYQIYGRSPQDMDNRIDILPQFIHPDDLGTVQGGWNESLETNDYQTFFYRIIRPSGEIRFVEGKGYIYRDINSTPVYAVGYLVDVTDRVLHERKLLQINRKLEDAQAMAHLGIWELDTTTGNMQWSDELFRIVGIKPGSIKPTLELTDTLLHPDDFKVATEAMTNTIKNNEPYHIKQRIIRPDGEVRRILSQAEFVPEPAGEPPYRIVGSFLDITELEEATENLRQTLRQLEISNEALEQFAYVASHDLREPMNTLGNYMNLIKKKYSNNLDETGVQMLEYAYESSERMKSLIEALLQYSRLNIDMSDYRTDIDIAHLISTVLQDLSDVITENNAQIEVVAQGTIWGYPVLISQIFANLITNAIRYAQPDIPPEIHIDMQETDTHWQFTVQDNGIGITKKHWHKIFEIFKQLKSSSKSTGVGIGLALCQRIVHIHKGDIWVESKPGNGSTFFFTLSKKQPIEFKDE